MLCATASVLPLPSIQSTRRTSNLRGPTVTTPANLQQYSDLTQLYSSYSAAELNNLALTFNDLTEVAQLALKAEFTRRGLPMPAPAKQPSQAARDRAESALHGLAANAPQECIFEFADLEDAYLAQSVLKSAGIPSVVPTSEIAAIDTPRLIVGPADAQSAQLILSRPNALGSDEDATFATAVCPQCGTPDPLLESVEPTNQWRCEVCNHTWQDAEL
jgi:hypothetical protein